MRLKDWRIANNVTLAQLADELNVAVSTIVRWENGERDPDRAAKERIFLATRGAVEPNDFYDMPRWRRALSAVVAALKGAAA